MTSLSHVPTALLRGDSKTNDGVKVTALPIFTKEDVGFEVVDLEACRTDSDMTVQELSITKKGNRVEYRPISPASILLVQLTEFIESLKLSELPTALKRVWQSASVLILPVTKLWRKPEPDPYWEELPRKIKCEKLEDYCQGIPQLAAFINSDDDFCVWRTFGQLHSRILLQKLLELNCLETKLQELDHKDNLAEETRYRLQTGEHCDGWDATQKNLVNEIGGKLLNYVEADDLLLKHHGLKNIPKPSKLNYDSMLNYIWRTRPLEDGHFDFAFRKKDFVRLGPRPQTDELQDRLLRWISRWSKSPLNKLFRDCEQSQCGIPEYYSTCRLNFVVKSFITLLIISILMVPILLLYLIQMEKSIMVVVVLVSLFVFAVSLSLFRDSKPQDMFFGTATYCAVILVFLAGQTGVNNAGVSSGT